MTFIHGGAQSFAQSDASKLSDTPMYSFSVVPRLAASATSVRVTASVASVPQLGFRGITFHVLEPHGMHSHDGADLLTTRPQAHCGGGERFCDSCSDRRLHAMGVVGRTLFHAATLSGCTSISLAISNCCALLSALQLEIIVCSSVVHVASFAMSPRWVDGTVGVAPWWIRAIVR